jgi:hypothetical protein
MKREKREELKEKGNRAWSVIIGFLRAFLSISILGVVLLR